jgi:hypothetical protein
MWHFLCEGKQSGNPAVPGTICSCHGIETAGLGVEVGPDSSRIDRRIELKDNTSFASPLGKRLLNALDQMQFWV